LDLQGSFSWIKVVSINCQPLHAAIPEGPTEEILTPLSRITDHYNGLRLSFGPQSFMQVTHQVAEKLYGWVADRFSSTKPQTLLDLFCGVGGFALTSAPYAEHVVGVELSSDAVECAKANALQNGIENASFFTGDMLEENPFSTTPSCDALVVNPPRRGLGEALCRSIIDRSEVSQIVYSSCNPESLSQDLAILKERFTVTAAQAFDMFPLTWHMEVGVDLLRSGTG
jgi:23S rRNA (uracil747-C5)-methyltransferase